MPERKPNLILEKQSIPGIKVKCPHCGKDNTFLQGRNVKLCDHCSRVYFRDGEAS
jgi:uncharacterized protein (DUF983 family)